MAVLNARIESLAYYPVKGCRRIECAALELVPAGARGDREWMIVGPDDQFVTQRTDAILATIAPVTDDRALTLSAPGHPPLQVPLSYRGERRTVRIWKDTCAADDMGDAAADWLTAVGGRPLRLVRFAADGVRHADKTWARDDFAPVKFTDAYPVLVTQSASLGALNAALGRASEGPLPMNRFRPNIVLGGLAAWDEDRIEHLRIGGVLLRLAKPSTRCIVTTTNQDSGARGVEPLPTLKRLRWHRGLKGVTFGVNATVLQPGTVRVGDVVEIAWRESAA
ncbi:MAG: putative protein YcbX [Steroidobacteraceae bacterium]|nr:putative protein YcbX [Steroidobacteraceae bacterium]